MNRVLIYLLVPVLLSACGAENKADPASLEVTAAAAETNPVDGIDWFDGTVDEAFAAGKATGKSIYLYWGAEWCPPCHAISATVFKSPEFIKRSQLFIPVYLDGDKENAQQYGEKFGVRGYPTMIVFDSAGKELTRIPGGIDLQAYANILDLTLSNASSAHDLTTAVMAGQTNLSAADCTLLAYNSWGQDTTILVEYDETEAFRRMYGACPPEMRAERAILYLSWLDSALDSAEDEENPVELSEAQRAEALAQVEAVLADPDLVKANIINLLFNGARITAALTAKDSAERDALTKKFDAVFEALKADESVYKRERIYTLAGKMKFERIEDAEAELSAALQQEIRDVTVWADETTPGAYERLPIVNALANVLLDAGMDDVAKPLLLAEVDRSKQGYYFMPAIADIEQRAGNEELAIAWLRKAYDTTRGPATRFQWGYYYLTGLLEMAPDDVDRIHDTTVGLIAELQQSGGFYQRPKAQLRYIEQKLTAWAEENGNDAAIDGIREAVLAVCAATPSADASCESFLESV